MQSSLEKISPDARPLRGLVFAKYGDRAASTRQRFVQAYPYLAAEGITLTLSPLFDNAYLETLFRKGTRNKWRIAHAYLRRLLALFTCHRYDFILVHYELFPYLPAWFESLIRVSRKPILYDMDDAIFHQYDQNPNRYVRRLLGGKIIGLLGRCRVAFCGNAYLTAYACQYCKRTHVVPTTVDITTYQPATAQPARTPPTLGWIGSPSTWQYCAPFAALFASLVKQKRLDVLVVGAGAAANVDLPFLFRDWTEQNEIADIQQMDIGMMPLPDAPWARGKCGYKLIQYMACGIPVIASPVGVNRDIVTHGVNGFLATTEEEWRLAIEQLVGDPELRKRMGEAGRVTAVEHYSIQQHGPRLAQWIREICG